MTSPVESYLIRFCRTIGLESNKAKWVICDFKYMREQPWVDSLWLKIIYTKMQIINVTKSIHQEFNKFIFIHTGTNANHSAGSMVIFQSFGYNLGPRIWSASVQAYAKLSYPSGLFFHLCALCANQSVGCLMVARRPTLKPLPSSRSVRGTHKFHSKCLEFINSNLNKPNFACTQ